MIAKKIAAARHPAGAMMEVARIGGGDGAGRWFSLLSERAAAGFTDKTAAILMARVEELMSSKEFASDVLVKKIKASRGDVSKVPEFVQAAECAGILASRVDKSAGISPRVTELSELVEFLQSRTPEFRKGFDGGSFGVSNLYLSLVLTVFHATATLILRGMDYVKSSVGNYEIRTRMDAWKELEDDVVLGAMQQAVASVRNGKMDRYLKGGDLRKEEIMAFSAAAIFIIWVLANLRNLVYMYMNFRKRTSDWFASYADFIEMHAATLAPDRRATAKRQEAIAIKFRKLADIFSVEAQLANRNTAAAAKKQDIEVSGEARDAHLSTTGPVVL